jgi:hypothetical protein
MQNDFICAYDTKLLVRMQLPCSLHGTCMLLACYLHACPVDPAFSMQDDFICSYDTKLWMEEYGAT